MTQPVVSCTDHELVAAVRLGSDRAFDEAYARYHRRINAYVHGIVGDPVRAEDVTQEVFLSAVRRIRASENPIVLRPWLFEIARNASLDELRRQRRRPEEMPLDAISEELSVSRPVGLSPELVVENKQRIENLRGAFGGLSEQHHHVVVLRELEGRSYAEIADRLGVSRTVVQSTLFRARHRLSQEYRELASGRRCVQVQSLIDGRAAQPLLSLGVRQRRSISRHLAHCQACRRHARLAGVDERFFAGTRRSRIAALLPLPWLGWRRGGGSPPAGGPRGANVAAAVRPLGTVASLGDPSSGALALLGRAATAGAAVLIAAVGGGFPGGASSGKSAAPNPVRPAQVRPALQVAAATSDGVLPLRPTPRPLSGARTAAPVGAGSAVRPHSAGRGVGGGRAGAAPSMPSHVSGGPATVTTPVERASGSDAATGQSHPAGSVSSPARPNSTSVGPELALPTIELPIVPPAQGRHPLRLAGELSKALIPPVHGPANVIRGPVPDSDS